jgi:hypothetical protein
MSDQSQSPEEIDKPDPKKVVSQLSAEDQALVDIDEGKQAQRELTDADVVDMGQLQINFGEESSDDATTSESQAGDSVATDKSPADEQLSPADKPAEKKVFKVGKREFESAEAMADYIMDMERKQAEKDAYNKGVLDAVTPTEPVVPEIDPAKILFDDPEKAIRILREQIKAERDAERLAEQRVRDEATSRDKTWKNFYETHPDLKGWEKTVRAELQELVSEGHAGTGLDEGLKIVAKRARDEIAKAKQRLAPREELSSAPAVTSGSGGNTVPKAVVEQKVTSFIDEIRGLKRKSS